MVRYFDWVDPDPVIFDGLGGRDLLDCLEAVVLARAEAVRLDRTLTHIVDRLTDLTQAPRGGDVPSAGIVSMVGRLLGTPPSMPKLPPLTPDNFRSTALGPLHDYARAMAKCADQTAGILARLTPR